VGQGIVVARGNDELGLTDGAVWCDAVAFEEALDEGRAVDALDLYRGDLLEGFFATGASPEFDQWLGGERARLRRRAAKATRELMETAEGEGNRADAVRWARRVCLLDPYDEITARRLIALLDEMGDRAGALRVYGDLAARLGREFEAEPAAETRALIERVRSRELEVVAGAAAPLENGIAVLPFQNIGGGSEAQPFVLGLHDDLLTELSRFSALSVIARTSVLRYRSTTRPITEIARELGVATIVEGAVQSAGDRLRLNVQVIDGRTGAHRWAERYDRELSARGIFDLQGELAQKIAGALRAELTPAELDRRERESTIDLEAYGLYAQGRAHLDQRTRQGMLRSLDYFERAVDLDPEYALAWAGLADALSLLRDYEYETDQVLPRAEHAVQRALALDPTLAEAHTSLGEYHIARRNGPPAVEALRRALELRAGYAEAHNWLGWISHVLGDRRTALESARRAVALDPLSPEAISNLALSLLSSGYAAEALDGARKLQVLQPDWTTGGFYEGLVLYHLGRPVEAASVLQGLEVEWAGSGPKLTLALACVADGQVGRARRMLAEFEQSADAFAEGVVRLSLGEHDLGMERLRAVPRWSYWPALAMHHFYPDVLGELRAGPSYRGLRPAIDRSWAGAPTANVPLSSESSPFR
jgi:TolB-like protein